jgi:hypothetical protein
LDLIFGLKKSKLFLITNHVSGNVTNRFDTDEIEIKIKMFPTK